MAYPPQTPKTYVTPLQNGIQFEFISAYRIFPYNSNDLPSDYSDYRHDYYQKVTTPSNEIWENTYTGFLSSSGGTTSEGQNIGYSTTLQVGTYTVFYRFSYTYPLGNLNEKTATYKFEVVENQLPLKKWTVTDVINRLLDVAEPHRKGEKPRFRLNGMRADGTIITEANRQEGESVGQAALFDTILSPEFSFTKETLRECLQEIGQVVHGEPRLKPVKGADGVWYFEVRYDMYAGKERSMIKTRRYIVEKSSQDAESYASHLDSATENLVNVLDKYSGVFLKWRS